MASRQHAHLGLNQCGSGKKNEEGTFMYDESHTEANRTGKSSVHVVQAENTDKGQSKALWSRTRHKQQVVHERTPFSQRVPALLELQESFSKSEAHRGFNGSITPALVNLRDNVAVGRKHNFHGINCYYYHG